MGTGKKLFISWSGPIGKKAANLISDLIKMYYENAADEVFLSTRMESGL